VQLSDSLPTRTVCLALSVSRSTLVRRRRGSSTPQTRKARHEPRQLSEEERRTILALLHSDRSPISPFPKSSHGLSMKAATCARRSPAFLRVNISPESRADARVLQKPATSRLRWMPYFSAMSATRYNPILKALYDRLIAVGKPKSVALCAVMRKLLVLAYGVLKSNQPFNPAYANA